MQEVFSHKNQYNKNIELINNNRNDNSNKYSSNINLKTFLKNHGEMIEILKNFTGGISMKYKTDLEDVTSIFAIVMNMV